MIFLMDKYLFVIKEYGYNTHNANIFRSQNNAY